MEPEDTVARKEEDFQEDVNYFAYGANMASRVMTKRRGIAPIWSSQAHIMDWELSFTHPGINFLEPRFANITPQHGSVVFGVIYRISVDELYTLAKSESSKYTFANAMAQLRDGTTLPVIMLTSEAAKSPGLPSKRYLDLMLEGAKEFHLPSTFIKHLELHPSKHVPMLSPIFGWSMERVHSLLNSWV
ncbi:gamma-glutamylcyclotransferase [Aestuariibacter sp. AA17]|uniref:Gamma-glutamylcyclotransferase n=1 Tax=Fluctibacter corallii TaxID=2984329 RepID=A0ABT3AAM3_9ALTE|nr:gamma-glutamylcyclotransferase family protein [Aestuariibacter sp. AA17]MCV2885732.1 gamma-glutamylcyclotransferase [Aestuariibacter sp. AA17]